MDNCNLIFLETPFSQRALLGRTCREFVLKEFADFDAVASRIVRQDAFEKGEDEYLFDDALNVVLALDMPLVRVETLLHYIALFKLKGIGFARLGGKDAISRVCIGKAKDDGIFVNDDDFLKIGDAKSFNMVYNLLKDRILDNLLANGVCIFDKNTVFVDDTAKVQAGAQILPFSRVEGDCIIKAGARISSSYVKNCVVECDATVDCSHIVGSLVGAGATVGPFARLRGATVGQGVRVGDFVEVKASKLHSGVKAAHLCYIGDADVGENTNVGCGTVFCNFDGKDKHKTTVGSGCFIGANTNLVAPLVVGDGAYIAAGTTVTRDVSEKSFTIGRVKQDTKSKFKP